LEEDFKAWTASDCIVYTSILTNFREHTLSQRPNKLYLSHISTSLTVT